MSEGPAPTTPLDYRNPTQHVPVRRRSVGTIVAWWLGGLGAGLLLICILLPSLGRAREGANRIKCASNLRQIGQAAMFYANDHGGQLPPDVGAMILYGDVTSEVFICPSCDLDRATGATTRQVVSSLLSGDHLSFQRTGYHASGENSRSSEADPTKLHRATWRPVSHQAAVTAVRGSSSPGLVRGISTGRALPPRQTDDTSARA